MEAPSLAIVGAGTVGRALAVRWRALHPTSKLRLVVRSGESARKLTASGFDALDLDLVEDTDRWGDVLAGCRAVVFCAAAGRGGDYDAIYARGIARIVAAMNPGPTHLVYTSSTGIYAEQDGGWVDESAPLSLRDPRVRALARAEEHVHAAGGTVLRLSGIVAPHRGPQRTATASSGVEREDGDGWLNLAPLSLIVEALRTTLELGWRGVANVSSAAPMRRRDFYDAVLSHAGLAPVRWKPAAPDTPRGRRVRVDRLRDELGVPVKPLELDALLADRG